MILEGIQKRQKRLKRQKQTGRNQLYDKITPKESKCELNEAEENPG